MSPKQWLSLLTFYILYLIFGASVFYHVEHKLETDRRAVATSERIEINALLRKFLAPNNTKLQEEILEEVSDYCGKPVTHPSKDEFVAPYIWNFYHAFFFSFTVCSTVGYGNITPTNTFGRIFLMFYGIVGLPVHAILFAYMGNFWGNSFVKLYKRYKDYKLSVDPHHVPRKISLIGQISLYLFPGVFVFIFAPAMLFSYFEDWEYTTSVYYTFVTLTTIGFGDFVPTFQKHQEHEFGIFFVFYELFILCWFIAGVSYIAMLIGFLIKGLRSKKIKRIEHNLAINIKETQKKIWNGVQKDVGYIRKILNEVYFLKFKPVYKDPEEMRKEFHIPRSQSCPHLFINDDADNEDEDEATIIPNIKQRERAFSEHCIKFRQRQKSGGGGGVNSISSMTLNRPQSDSDLSNIDKEKTFDAQRAAIEPGELLAKVAFALGGFQLNNNAENSMTVSNINESPYLGGGIHGFSDSQILASEQGYSDWSLGTSEKSFITPVYRRSRRAFSEVRIPIEDSVKASTEWTWSGANTQISEIERIRSRATKPRENLYKASFQQSKLRYDTDVVDDFPREFPTKMNGTATNKSLFRKLNPFKKKSTDMLMKRHSLAVGIGSHDLESRRDSYIGRGRQNGRASISSLSKSYLTQPRPSLFATQELEEEQEDLLETTSVADLIRAIEIFHTDSAIAEKSLETPTQMMSNTMSATVTRQHEQQQQKKNLVTDHLTTPRKSALLTLLHRRHHSSHTIHGPTAVDNAVKRTRLYSCVTENLNDNEQRRIFGDVNPFIKQQRLSPSLHPPPPYSSPTSTVTSGIRNDSINPTLKRRFSVRPANLDKAPGQFHKVQNYSSTAVPKQTQSLPPTSITPPHAHQQLQSQAHQQEGSIPSPAPFTRKL